MLDDVTIKEFIPIVGVRLKFQKAFSQLVSKGKVPSDEKDDNLEGDVGLTTISEESTSAKRSSNVIFTLDEATVRVNSKIFGLKNPSANLTQWQKVVNDCAFELAKSDANLLYNRGLLKEKAEERARASYIFKKKTGSRSTKVLSGTEPEPKRQKLSKEDRAHEIHTVSTEIDMIKKHIIIKQQMISKASSVKDFHLCDNEQKEMRELVKKKFKLEKTLKELQKKEAKGKWYEKTKNKNANISTSCSNSSRVISKKPLPPKSAANTKDIRTLFTLKPYSSTSNKGTHNAQNEVDESHTEGETKSGEKEVKDDEIENKENQASDGMKSDEREVKYGEIHVIENQASDGMKSDEQKVKDDEIQVTENQASDGMKLGEEDVKDEIEVIENQPSDGMKSCKEDVNDDEIEINENQASDAIKVHEKEAKIHDDQNEVRENQANDAMDEVKRDDESAVSLNKEAFLM